MPMSKAISIDMDVYNARIYINGHRAYQVTDTDVFVEMYQDLPSVSPEEFWRDYAYSGDADKWFSQIDPDTIQFTVAPGQYDVGSGVRAYGRLSDASESVVQGVKESRDLYKVNSNMVETLEKKIESLKHDIDKVKRSIRQVDIKY